MANYKVISDIGKTVINMLKDNLVPNLIDNSDDIGICDLKSRKDFVVGLHLYDIIEKRDTPKGAFVDLRDGRRSNPPTEYKLCYMISISSKQDISNKVYDEHLILGYILQLFNDNKVLPPKYMVESLRNANETINLLIPPLSLEEKGNIWRVFNEPYELSVFFDLDPVYIESTQIRVPAKKVTTIDIVHHQKK